MKDVYSLFIQSQAVFLSKNASNLCFKTNDKHLFRMNAFKMKKRLKKLVAALSVYYDKWVSEWASISQKPEVSSAAPGWLFFLYALLTFFLPWSVEVSLGER